jgi:nitroreductase
MPRASAKTALVRALKLQRDTQLATAAQIGMFLVSPERFLDDATSLQIGRAWQRLHLAATLLGLSCQPINQIPLRISRERQLEWPPDTLRALGARVPLGGRIPAFCFRIGYPTREAPHAPRRTIDQVTGAR